MNIAALLFSLAMAAIPLKSGTENSFRSNEEQVYVIHYKWGVLNADVARAHVTTSVTTHGGKPAVKAKMYGHTGKFTPNEGVTVPEGYTDRIDAIVRQKIRYSDECLDLDYFDILFGH